MRKVKVYQSYRLGIIAAQTTINFTKGVTDAIKAATGDFTAQDADDVAQLAASLGASAIAGSKLAEKAYIRTISNYMATEMNRIVEHAVATGDNALARRAVDLLTASEEAWK